MKFDKLGWMIAAGLACSMIGMGFQNQGVKIGVVDMSKVFGDSDYVTGMRNELKTAQASRTDALTFIGDNKAMKPEDGRRYAELAVKTNANAAEKSELERIIQDAKVATTKQRELATKANPTDAEQKMIGDFAVRSQANTQLQQQLASSFEQDLRDLQEKLRNQTLEKVKDAVKDVAGKQGYSVIFSNELAPYSPNDITEDALKSMNKKK